MNFETRESIINIVSSVLAGAFVLGVIGVVVLACGAGMVYFWRMIFGN